MCYIVSRFARLLFDSCDLLKIGMAEKLYAPSDNFRTSRILVAAEYGKTKVNVDKSFKLGETNASGDFLKKFPFGKVPALETANGKFLFGTSAICQHVGKSIAGDSDFAKAEVIEWSSFADQEILPPVLGWVLPSLSVAPHNKQAVDEAKAEVLDLLTKFDNHLLTRTYLVGERITLADVAMCCNLLLAYQHVMDANTRKPFMNVTRWFETCINQPEFKKVLGDFKLCEKAAQFDAKKHKEYQSQASTPSAKKDKKQQQQKEQPKKQEKAPEENGELDPSEEAMALEPKKKDPFEAYPKGTFNMDEWKRTYSNEDTIEKAIPYFWQNFDAENYSVWYCEYKFPKDLTQVFMSCNLISGMFQRLDKLRKNAFASMALFGTNNDSTISGVWIWRGHDLAFELSDDWQVDYESYKWTKMDPKDEKTKKMVNEYWAWEGSFDGKSFNQGKIFK